MKVRDVLEGDLQPAQTNFVSRAISPSIVAEFLINEHCKLP